MSTHTIKGTTLSEQVFVNVRRINAQHRPPLVMTNAGPLQVKRGMSKADSAQMIQELGKYKETGIPCLVLINRQNAGAGSRHTLLRVEPFRRH